jgi:hypothetical protein
LGDTFFLVKIILSSEFFFHKLYFVQKFRSRTLYTSYVSIVASNMVYLVYVVCVYGGVEYGVQIVQDVPCTRRMCLWWRRTWCTDRSRTLYTSYVSMVASNMVYRSFRTYLVHVVCVYGGVERGVQIVQEIHDLHGRAHGRDGGEAHDVAERDGHLGKALRVNM